MSEQKTTQLSRAYVAQPLADALNQLDILPQATLTPVWTQNPDSGTMDVAEGKRAIWVGGKFSNVVSDRYTLVQHREAFEPVLNALLLAGEEVNLKARMASDLSRAHLDCIVDNSLTDTVRLGFRVDSVLDGAHSIRYSFSAQKIARFVEKVEHKVTAESANAPLANAAAFRYIELVGFRQSCANGMKVRVPVAEAEFQMAKRGTPNFGVGSYSIKSVITDIWTSDEAREAVETLASKITNIKHTASAPELVKQQRQAVALMLAMRAPVQRLIQRAGVSTYATSADALKALTLVVGESKAKQIWHANRTRSPEFQASLKMNAKMTAWDLYNAMTFHATHVLPEGNGKELLENQAADYLVLLTGASSPNFKNISASVSV